MTNHTGNLTGQRVSQSSLHLRLLRLARLKPLIAAIGVGGLFVLLTLTTLASASSPTVVAQSGDIPFLPAWSSTELDSTRSVAWGDYDTDGDLDLAVGNYSPLAHNRLYCNGDAGLTLCWSSVETDTTTSVAWGDYNTDGDLDLAAGNDGQPNRLYRNDQGTLTVSGVWTSTETDATTSVAWGDFDGLGGPDLAVGNIGLQLDRVYCSGAQGLTLCWSSDPFFADQDTYSVAWGDIDGDGDLDLVTGGGAYNLVYCNEGRQLIVCGGTFTGEQARSVAWGDYDSDGDLDLIAGNGQFPLGQRLQLYRNDGRLLGELTLTSVWSSTIALDTWSVAWGDADGDGDLDLAVGNRDNQPNQLYRNNRGTLAASAARVLSETQQNRSLAWGDVDGDNDLDLAVGSNIQPNRLYRNEGGVLTPAWTAAATDTTFSVAWGDVDGDGDLDLAVGNNFQPNRLYRNNNGTLTATSVWTSTEADATTSLAWGDVDNDGDLDLAVVNFRQPNRLYRNDNGTLTASGVWTSTESDWTTSVAWGDVDGDGDLDLAVGNNGQSNRLYRNDDGMLTATAVWASAEIGATSSLAWSDVDNDGDLDLAVGNTNAQANRLYRNEGRTLTTSAVWSSNEIESTTSVAWGDADGDGDLDLVVGNLLLPNRLYRNDGGTLSADAVWSSLEQDLSLSLAWGDVDNDGDLDLAVGNGANIKLYVTRTPAHPFHLRRTAAVTLGLTSDPAPTFSQTVTALAPANFYAIPGIRAGTTIPISYTISDPESSPRWRVRGFFSPDGGGRWFPAIATADTMTRNVTSGVEHVYVWDVANSGFFGQSDNVVFRLEALPGGPLPSQHPYVTAQTYPFRVRGAQVRVVHAAGQPARDALVYRLPRGQSLGGQPMGGLETPFRTSPQGYLHGRGELRLGDQLIALWPVTPTEKYTLYHTSATPIPAGLAAFTVAQAGVQTLTVSTTNPLLLFNLNVSLEWDASNDQVFLAQLGQNLAKTSAALYDWSNGQVALGRVSVYQDKARWAEADIRIFASNQVRPIANRGGIVTQTTVLSFTRPITFSSGEIRIGPTWNRYGDPAPIGDDWPRVLAHELGHYALFLEDTYLKLDENGLLVPSGCTGTAMSDPYDDSSSEFGFQTGCVSLAELPDWNLLTLAYPALHAPPPTNSGPAAMPFDFIQIDIRSAPSHPKPRLNDFNIDLGSGGSSLSDGRAYLRHPGEGLVDLGRPVLNSVLARGAREGDELCIFAAAAFACSPLSNSVPTQLMTRTLWQPEIILTPVNSTTLEILVNATTSGTLTATVYPNGVAPQVTVLTPTIARSVTLSQPAIEVLVDITGNGPGERMITGYATGAGPGQQRGHGGPGQQRGHGGPFASGDGSLIIYPPRSLPNDVFIVVQTATHLPELPPGLAAIGRAYHIRPSIGVTDFTGASVSFQYLGLDVLLADVSGTPQEKEASLAVEYWDGTTWTLLKTTLNSTQNFASALLPRPGLYVLTAGRAMPTLGAVSPASGESGQAHALTIVGENFLAPLALTLRGQTSVTYPLTVSLVNSRTVLAATPITLPVDLYDLELSNAGGLTARRDSAFALYTPQPEACFFDDFASGWGKWTRTGEWDIVTAGGQEAATDSPGASYLNAEPGLTRTTTITSQGFNLATCPDPVLTFRHDYVIAIGPGQYQDWGRVEISVDDGQTWLPLTSHTGGGPYAALRATTDEWSQVAWKIVALNLAQAGVPTGTMAARLRFSLMVDAAGSDKGWIIDDVMVRSSASGEPRSKVYLPVVAKNRP